MELISPMEQIIPKEVNVENLIPVVKNEPTETPVCGCRGQVPASYLLSLIKK